MSDATPRRLSAGRPTSQTDPWGQASSTWRMRSARSSAARWRSAPPRREPSPRRTCGHRPRSQPLGQRPGLARPPREGGRGGASSRRARMTDVALPALGGCEPARCADRHLCRCGGSCGPGPIVDTGDDELAAWGYLSPRVRRSIVRDVLREVGGASGSGAARSGHDACGARLTWVSRGCRRPAALWRADRSRRASAADRSRWCGRGRSSGHRSCCARRGLRSNRRCPPSL